MLKIIHVRIHGMRIYAHSACQYLSARDGMTRKSKTANPRCVDQACKYGSNLGVTLCAGVDLSRTAKISQNELSGIFSEVRTDPARTFQPRQFFP